MIEAEGRWNILPRWALLGFVGAGQVYGDDPALKTHDNIAVGPNPAAAFLNMVVMVTLGRMAFEQHYSRLYGDEVAPLVEGFKNTEADIWQLSFKHHNGQKTLDTSLLIVYRR